MVKEYDVDGDNTLGIEEFKAVGGLQPGRVMCGEDEVILACSVDYCTDMHIHTTHSISRNNTTHVNHGDSSAR